MTKGCTHTDILARGLCGSCYQALSRFVRLGRVTWAGLINDKRALPPRRNKAIEQLLNN